MNTYTEDMKAELAYHEYKNPPVTDLQMEAQSKYREENRTTKLERRKK